MATMTVLTRVLRADTSEPLSAAERVVAWELAAIVDERRIKADEDNAIWLEVEAARLRGPEGRDDNQHLTRILSKLARVQWTGEDSDGTKWFCQLIAEGRVKRSVVRLLLPPRAVQFLRTPGTFAKLDRSTVHALPTNARTLYGLLADRFRQTKPEWIIDLETLKDALGVSGKYDDWFDFRKRVLEPSIKRISEVSPAVVTWEPEKMGRAVVGVCFKWRLKAPDEAADTEREQERPAVARGKVQQDADAPPLVVLDRAARFLTAADFITRKYWAQKATERGATFFPGMVATDNVTKWANWVARDMVAEGVISGEA